LVPELADIIPAEPNKAFDIKKVIQAIVDDGEFLEVQPEFARSMVTGFARLGGHVIGIVANQSSYMAGVWTSILQIKLLDSLEHVMFLIFHCDISGHTWVHAWNAAGIRRHNTSRSKVALCLF